MKLSLLLLLSAWATAACEASQRTCLLLSCSW